MLKKSKLRLFIIGGIFFLGCQKATYQLPSISDPPFKISIAGTVNGLDVVDFIFEQTKTSTTDTVWLSIKNNTANDIASMKFLVELCKAAPQNYDNCNLQLTSQLDQPLKASDTLSHVFMWVNKSIQLDSSLINAAILSYSGIQTSSLANAYSSVSASYDTDTSKVSYYGNVRGYVSADGSSVFRFSGKDGANYNASGLFVGLNSFEGVLKHDSEIISPFQLYHINTSNPEILVDTSDGDLKFKLHLETPLQDTINYIFINAKKIF